MSKHKLQLAAIEVLGFILVFCRIFGVLVQKLFGQSVCPGFELRLNFFISVTLKIIYYFCLCTSHDRSTDLNIYSKLDYFTELKRKCFIIRNSIQKLKSFAATSDNSRHADIPPRRAIVDNLGYSQ